MRRVILQFTSTAAPAPSPGFVRRARRSTQAALFAVCALASPLAAEAPKEHQVKAAFLYNFTKFIDWPADCFPDAQAPLVIAVVDHPALAAELEHIVQNRTVNGRALAVHALPAAAILPPPGNSFHVLFVADGAEKYFKNAAALPAGHGLLTVGESPRFTTLGGMITFVVVDDKVRFVISRSQAESAGLKISAQLQKLATPPARPRSTPVP